MDIASRLRKDCIIESSLFWDFYDQFAAGKLGPHLGKAFMRRFPFTGIPHHPGLKSASTEYVRKVIFSEYTIKDDQFVFRAEQHTTLIELNIML